LKEKKKEDIGKKKIKLPPNNKEEKMKTKF
jgi:hypothetical protein